MASNSKMLEMGKRVVVSNAAVEQPPQAPTLMDNTLLFLPERAVHELGLEPNMDDKEDPEKELWFGRVWELRSLLSVQHAERLATVKGKQILLGKEEKNSLAAKLADPFLKARLVRLQAKWR